MVPQSFPLMLCPSLCVGGAPALDDEGMAEDHDEIAGEEGIAAADDAT